MCLPGRGASSGTFFISPLRTYEYEYRKLDVGSGTRALVFVFSFVLMGIRATALATLAVANYP
eukprot:scaffold623058_cov15-Prasinocladus_malaysianus.AAC.1